MSAKLYTRGGFAYPATSRQFKTGSWRVQKPLHQHTPAPCHAACPAGEDPQAYIAKVVEGHVQQAWETLVTANPLPAITGRVCPHFCETGCNRSQYDEAVARQHVLEKLPDKWCVRCHGNLLGEPSSGPVEIVHQTALELGRAGGHGCVTCHDSLHGPQRPIPEPKKYQHADNSFCHVCHINFMDEEFATVHMKANIGCVDCHGDCEEHIADESWASGGNGTPPGKMYTRDKINPACMACHPKGQMDKEQHEEFLAGTSEEKYCTDCHGKHRLANRKCKWK